MTRRKHLTTKNTGGHHAIIADEKGFPSIFRRRVGHAGSFRPTRKNDPRPADNPYGRGHRNPAFHEDLLVEVVARALIEEST